jgi:hypothetical protein
MPKQAFVEKTYYSASFSLLSVANTAVLDAISGKSLIATCAWLEIVSNTGIPAVNPIVSLGNNSTPFDNLMLETTPNINAGLNNDCQIYELPLGSTNPASYGVGRRWPRVSITSTGISVRVSTVASGGTVSALSGRIFLRGFLV